MEEFVQSLVQGGLSLLEAIFKCWWGLLGIALDWFIGQFKDFLIWLEPTAVEVLRGIFTPIFELVNATPWIIKMPVLFGLLAAVGGFFHGAILGMLELLKKPIIAVVAMLPILVFLPAILGLIVFGVLFFTGAKAIWRRVKMRKQNKELTIQTSSASSSA